MRKCVVCGRRKMKKREEEGVDEIEFVRCVASQAI